MLQSLPVPDFGACQIIEVEPNTEITDDRTGDKLTVTDTEAVHLRHKLYVTKRTADLLKASFESKEAK